MPYVSCWDPADTYITQEYESYKEKKFHSLEILVSVILFYYLFIYLCLIILFIYFWLCWVFVAARGLSLAVASGFIAVHGLLIAVASLVVEHGL